MKVNLTVLKLELKFSHFRLSWVKIRMKQIRKKHR